jgi:hypothetical protein
MMDKEFETDTRPETIDVPVWVKQGGMLIRRDALGPDDPDQTYNYIKNTMGLRPEDYGVYHPYDQEFARMSREQLIDEVIELRRAVEAYERMGF